MIIIMNEKQQEPIVRHKGIWKRFFHTCIAARIPYGLFFFYVFLTAIEGSILVRIPEVNANLFTGDVSVASVGTFLGFEILNMAVSQFILYVNHVLRYKMNRNLRNTLWEKILHLKPSYLDKVSSSSLISRISVDADAINQFVLDVVLELFVQIYYLTLYIREMNKISLRAGFILLAFLPLTILVTFVMGRLNLMVSSRMKHQLADLTAYLSELVTCLPLMKSMNRQTYEEKRGEKVIRDYYKAQRNSIGLDVLKELVGSIVGIGPEIAIILMGIKMLGNGTVDAAGWYTFYMYAGTFIVFCNTLGGMWENTKMIQGQLIKVSDVIYEDGEAIQTTVDEMVASGDIIFDHVRFAYGEDLIFKDANFTIPKNKYTVLIGYSGAGKSTILKLVERIYDPNEGRILMGGREISAYDIKDWRKNIAFVSQNTPLMSGSIRDNILYGIKREVSDEEVMHAATMAHLDEFIRNHPEGLDRQVGQFGGMLSGGQMQKISVARALLSDAELLILDEPTASLDIVSTNEIMHTIDQLRGTKTIIVVTHDAKVIRTADHIIVVNKDHSIQEGDHREMKLVCDFYRKMMNGERGNWDETAI